MARSYDVAAAALALDVDLKWLDNVLSHHVIPATTGGRQGVSRAITPAGMLHLAVIRALSQQLRVPVTTAVRLAAVLLDGQSGGAEATHPARWLTLRVDRAALEREVEERLLEAVELTPRRRRGRPPRRR